MSQYTSPKASGRFVHATTFGSYLLFPKSMFTERGTPDSTREVITATGGNADIGETTRKVPIFLWI